MFILSFICLDRDRNKPLGLIHEMIDDFATAVLQFGNLVIWFVHENKFIFHLAFYLRLLDRVCSNDLECCERTNFICLC